MRTLKFFAIFLAAWAIAFAQMAPGKAYGGASVASLSHTADGTGTVATTQADLNNRTISLYDYMSKAKILDAKAGTMTYDCTAEIQAAISDTKTKGMTLVFPRGRYRYSGSTPAIQTVDRDLYFESGAVIDATTTTIADNAIIRVNGSRGTGYANPAAITQAAKTFTANATLAASLASGDTILITSDPAGFGGSATTGGAGTITTAGVLTITTAPTAGTFSLGQVVTMAGLPAGGVIQSKLSGTLGAVGSTYQLGSSPASTLTTLAFSTNGDLWYAGRPYYYKGELAEVSSVSGTTITLKEPLRDSYLAYSTVSCKLSTVTGTFRGLRILGPNHQTVAQCGVSVYYGKNVSFQDCILDGWSWGGILPYYNLNLSISNVRTWAKYNTLALGYGVCLASSQCTSITNSRLIGGRCGITTTGQEPCRETRIVNSFLGTDDLSSDGCVDCHGNTDIFEVVNCTLSNGAALSGKTARVLGCTIYAPSYPLQYVSDFQGGSAYGFTSGAWVEFVNNSIIVPAGNPGTQSAVQVQLCGTMDNVVFRGNTVLSYADVNIFRYINAYGQSATITDFVFEGNDISMPSTSTGTGLNISYPATNVYISRNKFAMGTQNALSWTGSGTSSVIDITDNHFLHLANNAHSLVCQTSGATTIRFNRNRVVGSTNIYYPVAITSAGYLEALGNTFSNMNQGSWTFAASNTLMRDNTLVNVVRTNNTATGRVYRMISPNGVNVETTGTAAPTTLTWVAGDRCVNTSPAVGSAKAWLCTVGGTPGTWVSEGNL